MASWWPGHDLAKWGIWITIGLYLFDKSWGLFRAYIWPRIKKFLDERTVASRKIRIGQLEVELAHLDSDCPLLTATEEQIFWGIISVAQLLSFFMQMFGLLLVALGTESKMPEVILFRAKLIAVGAALLGITWIWGRRIRTFIRYRRNHSRGYRDFLTREVAELKATDARQ